MEYEYDDWKVCMDARERFMREMPVWGLNGKVSRASFGVLVLGAAIVTAFAGLGRSDLLVYVLPFAIAIGSLVANVASIALVLSYESRSRWAERCARWPLCMFVEAMNLDFDEQTMWLSELGDVTRSAFLEQRDGYITSIGKMSWAGGVGLALVIFSGAVCVGSLALCVISLPW